MYIRVREGGGGVEFIPRWRSSCCVYTCICFILFILLALELLFLAS